MWFSISWYEFTLILIASICAGYAYAATHINQKLKKEIEDLYYINHVVDEHRKMDQDEYKELRREIQRLTKSKNDISTVAAERLQQLKKYRKTIEEIAKGNDSFVRHKRYGTPEVRILSAQELAQEMLERGGKVS